MSYARSLQSATCVSGIMPRAALARKHAAIIQPRGELCLGDTLAAVNRSINAGGTEPPASYHVSKRKQLHSSGLYQEFAMTTPAYQSPPTLPERRPRRRLVLGIYVVLLIGFGTAGGLFFYGWQQTRQPVD